MKLIFLLPTLLWGCGLPYTEHHPVSNMAIKIASNYCEVNGGIKHIQQVANLIDAKIQNYTIRFECKNGLRSDWQEMKEEPREVLNK